MKTFTLKCVLTIFISLTFLYSYTQQFPSSYQRCGTYQAMEEAFRLFPNSKAIYEKDRAQFQAVYEQRIKDIQSGLNNRTLATINIPIVVHIVLSNPNLVTNAAVQSQLDILNTDYAGMNADSVDIPAAFKPFFAKGNLRFCLAQRDPNGLPTNGIVRVTSNTTSAGGVNDPVKFTAQGGSDAWPTDKYLNVWVCVMQAGLLGYSFTPGTAVPANVRGFLCDYRAFGNVGSYLYPEYNKGRTAVHEIGHFFNLDHTWGPNNCNGTQTCADDDGVADTPPELTCHFGCPTTTGQVLTDACSPNPPGYMYQNYMDYSSDRCMLLFTPGQNTRMEAAVANYAFLTSLANSNGCTPVVLTPGDAAISAIVTPANGSIACDPTVPLIVTLQNAGSNTLTSATITVQVNGTTVQTFSWAGTLLSLNSTNITLNALTLANGSNVITVTVSNPNGLVDTNPANNTATSTITRSAGVNPPLVESFTSTTFPPAGWTRINADNGVTWQRRTAQFNSAPASAWLNFYNYSTTGQRDVLRAPNVLIGTADSFYVSFWYAYTYDNVFGATDSLEVRVSTDCGATFTRVFKKGGAELATAPATGSSFMPTAAQWRRESIDLSSFISAGRVVVEFVGINGYGNNLFLDDINIDKIIFPNRDAGVVSIERPLTNMCTTTDKPVAIIKNFGKDPLTSVKVNYQVDNGTVVTFNWTGNLLRNQLASVTLADANLGAPGNHTIRVFTSEPNGSADQNPANDAMTKAYTVFTITTLTTPARIEEGFNTSTFPPAGWIRFNPDNDFTWQWTGSYGKKQLGAAWFNDYDNATTNRFDDLRMPNYAYNGIDSIFLNFQLSTVTYSYPGITDYPIDTFSVLISKDCGNTFTTVYKKWGEDLQTINDPNFPQADRFFPAFSNLWRMDSINLGRFLGASESLFQVAFRFHGNFENNFFLDDVNLFTEVVPAKLKTEGLLILPNPFRDIFTIRHYRQPANLKYVSVYNSSGQLVYNKKYNGNANTEIPVDLTQKPAGVYLVQLGYEENNRMVIQRIIKH